MEKRKLRKLKEEDVTESKVPRYLEGEVKKLSGDMKDKIKREIKACFKDPELMKFLLDNQADQISRFNRKSFALFEKKIGKMIQTLEKIQENNEYMEETLRNVFLAIRQNEYLQAWYPAQQGHPQMKVVGPHPIITERKMKAKRKK